MDSLPEQITIGQWNDGRRKPFFLRYGPRDARRMESFESEQDRNDAAEKLADARGKEGASILAVDTDEWREWKEFRKRCPAPLNELETLWTKHSATRTISVADAAKRYLATWTGNEPSFSHVRLHVGRLVARFGPTPLADLSENLLRELNAGLTNPRTGKPMSGVTKFDHRKSWNMFFEWCVLARLVQFNPCDAFTLPAPTEQERDILTPRQIFDLLKANIDEPVIGRMAFELYGGLRSSSVARLSAEHVKREIKGLRLPGAEHKSGKTKFRQKHPDVLWAWFDHAHPALWDIRKGSYDERKHDAFVRANVENAGNVLRSSFITYLLAFTDNPPLVARLAQHTSLKMLEIYEGVATASDAKLVMAMTPKAVRMTWDKFVRSITP